jgi:hypothetical protein
MRILWHTTSMLVDKLILWQLLIRSTNMHIWFSALMEVSLHFIGSWLTIQQIRSYFSESSSDTFLHWMDKEFSMRTWGVMDIKKSHFFIGCICAAILNIAIQHWLVDILGRCNIIIKGLHATSSKPILCTFL